jgi:hypothetical protein
MIFLHSLSELPLMTSENLHPFSNVELPRSLDLVAIEYIATTQRNTDAYYARAVRLFMEKRARRKWWNTGPVYISRSLAAKKRIRKYGRFISYDNVMPPTLHVSIQD